MAVVSLDLLKALKKAGVEDKLAEKAALEVAESTKLVNKQDKKIDALANKIDVLSTKVNIIITILVAFFATFVGTTLVKFFL